MMSKNRKIIYLKGGGLGGDLCWGLIIFNLIFVFDKFIVCELLFFVDVFCEDVIDLIEFFNNVVMGDFCWVGGEFLSVLVFCIGDNCLLWGRLVIKVLSGVGGVVIFVVLL